jgi:BirA family biotin operon repressor/biotin-[acetyl-CoA-carboxylase] ligase
VITLDIRRYDSVGSTNDEARRLAEGGAAHGTVVVAREQTAGRGRHGRHWVSPPGNLHASILLRLDLPDSRLAEVGFVASLAVADVVDAFAPGRAMLKWPNDVQVDGAKLSGILLEQAGTAIIIGIGINVQQIPADTTYSATSLRRIANSEIAADDVCHALLDALARRLHDWQAEGFNAVRHAWLARAHPPGTQLSITTSMRRMLGRFAGISDSGALLLETAEGRQEFVAGDVIVSGRA